MEPRVLTSLQNPVAQRIRRVTEAGRGRREGLFALEGRHLFDEALKVGWPVEILVIDRDLWPLLPRKVVSEMDPAVLYLAPRDLLARLGTVPSPEGILALCPRRKGSPPLPGPRDLFLYLDRVQDPANVGILIRTAQAFGLAGVVCGPGTADPFGSTALARSAGASLHINPVSMSEEDFLDWAGRHSVRILASDASGSAPGPSRIRSAPEVLAVGNEGKGLSPSIQSAAAERVGLPMSPGWNSLNVAAAGSILLYLLAGEPPAKAQNEWLSTTSPAL